MAEGAPGPPSGGRRALGGFVSSPGHPTSGLSRHPRTKRAVGRKENRRAAVTRRTPCVESQP